VLISTWRFYPALFLFEIFERISLLRVSCPKRRKELHATSHSICPTSSATSLIVIRAIIRNRFPHPTKYSPISRADTARERPRYFFEHVSLRAHVESADRPCWVKRTTRINSVPPCWTGIGTIGTRQRETDEQLILFRNKKNYRFSARTVDRQRRTRGTSRVLQAYVLFGKTTRNRWTV